MEVRLAEGRDTTTIVNDIDRHNDQLDDDEDNNDRNSNEQIAITDGDVYVYDDSFNMSTQDIRAHLPIDSGHGLSDGIGSNDVTPVRGVLRSNASFSMKLSSSDLSVIHPLTLPPPDSDSFSITGGGLDLKTPSPDDVSGGPDLKTPSPGDASATSDAAKEPQANSVDAVEIESLRDELKVCIYT